MHFHIGASQTSLTFYGTYFWPSLHDNMKPAVGGSMLFLNSARVIINSAYAGIFHRHPELKMVSVESGIDPDPLETVEGVVSTPGPDTRRKVLRDNAAALYQI